MRRLLCLLLVTGCACAFAASASASPTNLIVNGGFETGTFTGWSATTTLSPPLCPWQFNSCGWFTFVTPAVDGGSHFADNGFDGAGPGTFTLSQTVTIPAGTATLSWEDYVQATYSGTARTSEVRILDASGTTTLGTPYSYSVPTGTFVDTGWVQHSVDLSAFAGQTVEVAFVQTVPQNFTGPAEFDIDNVQLLASPSSSGARVGYCAGAGDTWADGSSIAAGTFLNLLVGQPAADPHYAGATPAIFVQGTGITCDPPPAGYARHGTAEPILGAGGEFYAYFAP
jgi:hypothetical protein